MDGVLRMADGGLVKPYGKARIPFKLEDGREIEHIMVVAEVESSVILGLDFLRQHDCVLEAAQSKLVICGAPYVLKSEGQLPSVCHVVVGETITIPPGCEMIVPGYVANPPRHVMSGIVEPVEYFVGKHKLAVARSVVDLGRDIIPLRVVMNLT